MKNFYMLLFALLMVCGASAQWVPQNSGTTKNLSSVYFTDTNTGYAVGDSGTILKTTDGENWVAQNSGTNISLHSVYFLDLMTGFCVGDSGTIIKTSDGGLNWNVHKIDSTIMLHSVHFPDESIGYIAGSRDTWVAPYNTIFDAIVLKSIDFGENWSENFITEGGLRSICFPSLDIGYAGGFVGGTPGYGFFLKTIDGGGHWSVNSMGSGFSSLCITNNDTLYALNGNYVEKSQDGGMNWTMSFMGEWASTSIYFLNNDIGYGVGYNYLGGAGVICKTVDDGENWYVQDSTLSSLPCTVFFSSTNTGYIIGSSGMILKTTNGGGFPTDIIESSNTTDSITIFPNPASTSITLETPTTPDKNTTLTIFNISVQAILSRQITEPIMNVDVSGLVSGVYFVRVADDRSVMVGKFVKQ